MKVDDRRLQVVLVIVIVAELAVLGFLVADQISPFHHWTKADYDKYCISDPETGYHDCDFPIVSWSLILHTMLPILFVQPAFLIGWILLEGSPGVQKQVEG